MVRSHSNLLHENIYFESHMLDSEAEKDFKLIELLKSRPGNSVIYCATGNCVDYVHELLRGQGLPSFRFHKRMAFG